MADGEKACEKKAATESLQCCFSSLVGAIQDPIIAASELYSVKLVSWPVVEKMPTLGLSKCEKNFQLLSAIRSQLATDPSGIEIFIQVLNTKLDLQEIAKGMKEKYQGEPTRMSGPMMVQFQVVWSLTVPFEHYKTSFSIL